MRRRASIILVCSCLTAAAAVVPAAAAPCGRVAAERQGRWFVATPPLAAESELRRLSGEYEIRAVAVDPADRRVVLVTDGAQVLRSDDGGCTWKQVYALPAETGTATPDRHVGEIASIDVARAGGRSRVLLTVESTAKRPLPTTYRTVVVRSDDGRTGWTTVADPAFTGSYGFPRERWTPTARSSGTVAYVALPAATGVVAYFRSTDGGRTWALRSSLADPDAPVMMSGFAVSPWNPDELWEWGGRWSRGDDRMSALRRSTDGGATWTWLDPWPAFEEKPGWTAMDVAWPRRDAPARLLVFGEAAGSDGVALPVVGWSGDAGRTFVVTLPPTRSRLRYGAVTHLPNGDAVVVAADKTAYRVAHHGRPPAHGDWRPLAPLPEPPPTWNAGPDSARASAARPGVVAIPGLRTVQLLAVPR